MNFFFPIVDLWLRKWKWTVFFFGKLENFRPVWEITKKIEEEKETVETDVEQHESSKGRKKVERIN